MARILIIDDDGIAREILRDILKHAGHEAVEAADSEEGVRLFREHPADLVITDLFMPQRGGLEVIGELALDYPGVRIIAVTGVSIADRSGILSLARQCGALRTFEKPVHPEALCRAIAEILGEGQNRF